MERITDYTHIGTVINDDFIAKVCYAVDIEASEDSWVHSPHFSEYHSADGDDHGGFREAIDLATDDHWHIFERDIQHLIDDKTEEMIKYRLGDEDLYGIPEDLDTTKCGAHIELEPRKINHKNQELVIQCLHDAANDKVWLQAEALQIFFQCINPCCWDGKKPRERYGPHWIEHTRTRLILMLYEIDDDLYKRCLNHGVTRSTLYIEGGYLLETNYHGTESYHPLPDRDIWHYRPADLPESAWKGLGIKP